MPMQAIQLNDGTWCVVDDDVFDQVKDYRWSHIRSCGKSYAMRLGGVHGVYMHRLIANTPKGLHTDHINGDGLDNRRQNLRVCTRSQNLHYSKEKFSNNTTGFRGVHLRKKGYIFSKIRVNGKRIHLGSFKTKESAAEAYKAASIKYFGKFSPYYPTSTPESPPPAPVCVW
jgi:hypothetical protein